MTDILTTRQVQDILKVDRITIYRMLQDGRLKGVKVGSQWRFTPQEVERLLNGGPKTTSTAAEGGTTFPVHCVQTIQNLLSGVSRMSALVIDAGGNLLTDISGETPFYRLVLSSPSGLEAFREACRNFASQADENNLPEFSLAGVVAAAAAIHDRGTIIGWFLVGQVFPDQGHSAIAAQTAWRLAAEYGLDPEDTRAAIREIPICSPFERELLEDWAHKAAQAVESILRERNSFMVRLEQIANLTQLA